MSLVVGAMSTSCCDLRPLAHVHYTRLGSYTKCIAGAGATPPTRNATEEVSLNARTRGRRSRTQASAGVRARDRDGINENEAFRQPHEVT
jgi:hypothetical protein